MPPKKKSAPRPSGSSILDQTLCSSEHYMWWSDETLGIGMSSTVHKCYHKASGKTFAAKVFDRSHTINAQKEEVKMMRSLTRPESLCAFLVAFEDFECSPTSNNVLIMELCSGESLAGAVNTRSELTYGLHEPEFLSLVTSVIEASRFLWDQMVLHLNISPDNLIRAKMVEENVWEYKLTGFSLAIRARKKEDKLFLPKTKHDKLVMLGWFKKGAGKTYAQASLSWDVYGVANCIHFAATGNHCFEPTPTREGCMSTLDLHESIRLNTEAFKCFGGRIHNKKVIYARTLPAISPINQSMKHLTQEVLRYCYSLAVVLMSRPQGGSICWDEVLGLSHLWTQNKGRTIVHLFLVNRTIPFTVYIIPKRDLFGTPPALSNLDSTGTGGKSNILQDVGDCIREAGGPAVENPRYTFMGEELESNDLAIIAIAASTVTNPIHCFENGEPTPLVELPARELVVTSHVSPQADNWRLAHMVMSNIHNYRHCSKIFHRSQNLLREAAIMFEDRHHILIIKLCLRLEAMKNALVHQESVADALIANCNKQRLMLGIIYKCKQGLQGGPGSTDEDGGTSSQFEVIIRMLEGVNERINGQLVIVRSFLERVKECSNVLLDPWIAPVTCNVEECNAVYSRSIDVLDGEDSQFSDDAHSKKLGREGYKICKNQRDEIGQSEGITISRCRTCFDTIYKQGVSLNHFILSRRSATTQIHTIAMEVSDIFNKVNDFGNIIINVLEADYNRLADSVASRVLTEGSGGTDRPQRDQYRANYPNERKCGKLEYMDESATGISGKKSDGKNTLSSSVRGLSSTLARLSVVGEEQKKSKSIQDFVDVFIRVSGAGERKRLINKYLVQPKRDP